MTNWKMIGSSAAFITLMGSTTAFADVSAKEVWADWHEYLTSFGYEVTFQEAMSGDTLNVNDLSISMALPDDGGKVNVNFGMLGFQERSNGTVAIIMPETMPISVDIRDEFAMVLNYTQSGMLMTVSGTPAEMAYDYSAAQIGLTIGDLMVEGNEIDTAKLDMTLSNVTSQTMNSTGNMRHMVQAFSSDMLNYDFSATEPGGGSAGFSLNGSIANLKGSSEVIVPKGVDLEQLGVALTAGFAGNGEFTWGASQYEFSGGDDRENLSGTSSSDSGELHFSMDRNSIEYGGSTKDTKAAFTTSEFPVPIDLALGESLFNLLMPVNKTDTPSDFGLTIKLGDFTVSDSLWGMIDPMAILPHDPATIHLDLVGKANWLIDIMDPEAAEMMDSEMPGQLHGLTLKALQIKMAGADLTGNGDFTFNNDDLATFGGMPAPMGAIDLKLTGINGLMDNLIQMGLLPEDQAAMGRMMMGMFAVAGEGEDTLISKIEVTADGQVLANGQRLQ